MLPTWYINCYNKCCSWAVVNSENLFLSSKAKLKLEMEIEQTKKRSQKEIDRKEEDMEEMKSNYMRKVTLS